MESRARSVQRRPITSELGAGFQADSINSDVYRSDRGHAVREYGHTELDSPPPLFLLVPSALVRVLNSETDPTRLATWETPRS